MHSFAVLFLLTKEDLSEERFPGSGKPLYTYDEIAKKHEVSKRRVQRVVEENDLSRRKNRIS